MCSLVPSDTRLITLYSTGAQFLGSVNPDPNIGRVRLDFVCDPALAEEVGELARENDVEQAEALRQLIEIGLEEVS
jgi:hypothetical protein